MAVLLIAEDDHDFRKLMAEVFRGAGHAVDEAADGAEARDRLHGRKYDLVLSDLMMPHLSGMDLLHEAKYASPDTEVIVITAYGSPELAVEALRGGAFDYIQKPVSVAELEMRAEKALRHRRLAKELDYLRHEQDVIYRWEDIVGASPALGQAMDAGRRLAGRDGAFLLRGETGTGRCLLAGAVHFNSRRRERGFVRVHCAGASEDHLGSDLFGHVPGGIPGAERARVGRIEQANGGTLLLDEVGEMPLALQHRLLGFLREGVFHRLGGTREVSASVRVAASTQGDLAQEVGRGRFLPELLDVLGADTVTIPPLRERREDIPALAAFFLNRLRAESGQGRAGSFTGRALKKLSSYGWPGNVYELRNVVERALLIAKGPTVDASDLQLPGDRAGSGLALTDLQLKDLEREAVLEALRKADFVQKEAARILGISKRVIHYKIQQFGIKHPRWIRNR